jgi:mono/diheme cytochrome c family protein
MRRALVTLAALGLAGCEIDSTILQRMEVQPKLKWYQAEEFFADKRAMREPPFGTIPRERPAGNPALTEGMEGGRLVSTIPIPLNEEVLARGRKKFEVVCAQCHGQKGDGNSIVAENMALRLPPNLVALADKPAGHFYQAIAYGYGVMPSFAGEIRVEDRWAVVAYVQALQRSQNVPLAEAPAQVQQELQRQPEEGRP